MNSNTCVCPVVFFSKRSLIMTFKKKSLLQEAKCILSFFLCPCMHTTWKMLLSTGLCPPHVHYGVWQVFSACNLSDNKPGAVYYWYWSSILQLCSPNTCDVLLQISRNVIFQVY